MTRRIFKHVQHVGCNDDAKTLEKVAALYGSIIGAGIHRASSIAVAEAAKVIENTQRDLNIALMNELALICDRLHIDTSEVLEAAATKWNFLGFKPGLVGGHCIGVDPYYLTHKAEMLGYQPQVILAGRRINDGMGKFIAEKTIKLMLRAGINIRGSKVIVLGLAFKENCPAIRNSRVPDIIGELRSYAIDVHVHDPLAHAEDARNEYGIVLDSTETLPQADAMIVAVAHDHYRANLGEMYLPKLKKEGVLIDVKSAVAPELGKSRSYWRL